MLRLIKNYVKIVLAFDDNLVFLPLELGARMYNLNK